MKPNEIPMTLDVIQHYFNYENGELVWQNRGGFHARLNGRVAGGVNPLTKYRLIKFNNVAYAAHRIVWIYFNGSISVDMQIDHINGNKSDNRIENLRLVTAKENCHNRSKHCAKGYTWNKAANKWQAYLMNDGHLKHLGCFSHEADARAAYVAATKATRSIHPIL